MPRVETFGRLPPEIEVLDPELWEAPSRLDGHDDCEHGDAGLRRTSQFHDNPQEDDDR